MRPETIESLRELRSNLRKASAYIADRISRDARELEHANAQIADLTELLKGHESTGEDDVR